MVKYNSFSEFKVRTACNMFSSITFTGKDGNRDYPCELAQGNKNEGNNENDDSNQNGNLVKTKSTLGSNVS